MKNNKSILILVITFTIMGCSIDWNPPRVLNTSQSECYQNKPDTVSYFEYIPEGKTIDIYHYGARYQCAAKIDYDIEIKNENNILLFERDTATIQANCDCNFDIYTSLWCLKKGKTYDIEIWNENKTVLLDKMQVYLSKN